MIIQQNQDDVIRILQGLGANNADGKTALVTGGAGFLGSWMCESLLKLGVNVICIDNLSSGSMANVSNLVQKPGFTFIQQDVSEPMKLDNKIDYVLHMASRASPFEFDKFPIEILKANTFGCLNALEVARTHNAKFLFTSTSEIYGNPAIVPTPESYYGNVNSVGIRGCYDEAKRCGEAYSMAYRRQYGLDIRIARIFNTYGPRMRADGIYGRVVPRFVTQALRGDPITVFGDGKQTRSFCYVTDQIQGLLKLLLHDDAAGEIVNMGNDHEVTVQELASLVLNLTASRSAIEFSPLPPDDPLRRRPEITKARKLLGWKPSIDLPEGLSRTISVSGGNDLAITAP